MALHTRLSELLDIEHPIFSAQWRLRPAVSSLPW
jgi:hypothetical protein